MKTRVNDGNGMKCFVIAGMLFLMMVMMVITPIKAKAAGAAPTKVRVPRTQKGRACVSVNIRWAKANGADGYIIYRSTSKYGKYKQIKEIKSDGVLVYNDSSVKEAKVYYYKVRAYKNCNGKKVFANFTSLKIDKVMKTVSTKKVSIWGKIKNFFS